MFARRGGGSFSRVITVAFDLSKWVVFFVVAVLLIHHFIATVFIVEGSSMEPNFHSGQIVLVNKLAYLTSSPKRGDVVVMRSPGDPERARYIKRIIGLPHETITFKGGKVYINDSPLREIYLPNGTSTSSLNYQKITLGDGEYFALGDNRPVSSDSRIWGPARRYDLIGRTKLILYPFSEFGYIADIFY